MKRAVSIMSIYQAVFPFSNIQYIVLPRITQSIDILSGINFFVVGAVLCIIGCLAASFYPTH